MVDADIEMSTVFDRITEGQRERGLVRTLRSGAVTVDNVEAHTLPFFVKIQIQTTSRCNGRCVTCPYPAVRRSLPQGEMADHTFDTVVDQLAGRGVERTSLFLMNEPLLDRRIERFTAQLKGRDPDTAALLYTNGLLLSERRARGLAEAGLDEVNVSINGFDRQQHDRVMQGVDFHRVMENLRQVGRLVRGGHLGTMRIRVVSLDLPGVREASDRFREETGFDVYLKPVTNRAGLIRTSRWTTAGEAAGPRRVCQRPFVKAYVLYNGDMVLCNCDWMRSTVIGNVNRSSLEDLWTGPRMMEIRRALLKDEHPRESPCAACDYPSLIRAPGATPGVVGGVK